MKCENCNCEVKEIKGIKDICPINKSTTKQRRKFALLEGKELKQKEIFGK